jgi:beta-glucosidase/6-phospho-beta-glucosidase/beta-galactosidase
MAEPIFRSFFIGGFECSSHRHQTGRRLDLLACTQHDRFVAADYRRLRERGILTARSGIRWHLIEPAPGRYDFTSFLPQLRSAGDCGIQVIWDLCHYGWPEDVDVFRPEFVRRFARLAREFARVYAGETDARLIFCPINEISFLSWAGGDVAYLNPHAVERGFELKAQLVRAAIEGAEAVWNVLPEARIAQVEPAIHIVARPERPQDAHAAACHRAAQFQAWDMLSGRMWPQLGGDPKYLDILGLNYYNRNQWYHGGGVIDRLNPLYRPFADILREVHERYGRPMFVAETGVEDGGRADWLRYVTSEVLAALDDGLPVEGICWYPIVNHPGWDDDRPCHNGLWGFADEHGLRPIFQPLADELRRQQQRVAEYRRRIRARGPRAREQAAD